MPLFHLRDCMKSTPSPKAYSYLRFSTPEQMQGDSFRRQTALAEAYALQHGLELDTSLTFHDAGVSAFRGRNVGPDGQLGAFLEAVREGIVAEGSYLLVESLDRISRQTARKALRSLEDVVEAGAVVVTLVDGRKYDRQSLDSDPTALLLSILTFMRAHEESAMKAGRLKAVWTEKRAQAVQSKKPMTRSCPAWLDLDRESGTFRIIPERVAVIERIFAMSLEGIGQGVIAQTLNAERVQPFGRGKHWHRTYIAKILENPAVLGTFVPHLQDHASGKRVRQALDPIEGYFPAVIPPEVVSQLHAMRAGSVQPRRGRHATRPLNNLFGGLGKCSICGETMTMTNKGDGNRYFICTRAKAGAGCTYRALPYQQIEDCFLAVWPEILLTMPNMSAESRRIRQSLNTLHEHMQWLDTTIHSIVQTIEGSTSAPAPASLLDRLGQLEHDRSSTMQKQQEFGLQQQAMEKNTLSLRLDTLRTCLHEQPIDKAKVNALLRQLFTAVHISKEAETLEFQWQHSKHRTILHYLEKGKRRVRKQTASDQVSPPIPLPSVPIVPVHSSKMVE